MVRTDQGVVMVPGVFPGDRVRLIQIERRGGAAFADRFELLTPSPSRVEPACEIADACGGCAWMRLAISEQRAAKQAFLERALRSVAPRLAFVAPHTLGYRAAGSNRVVHVERCVALSPVLEQARAAIAEKLLAALTGRGEIVLGVVHPGRASAVIRTESSQRPEAYLAAEAVVSQGALCGISLVVEGTRPATFGDVMGSVPAFDGGPLRVAAAGFTQAQDAGNAKLVEIVARFSEASGLRVLELYAGYGNLTVALAQDAAHVTAVELDADAAEACRYNLRARGLSNVRVETCDAKDAPKGAAHVVVLDPPRAGAKELVSSIAARRPKRVIYVSCDTATLERDLLLFHAEGYVPDQAVALDLFPQTAHIESIVRLVPASRTP